MQIAKIPNTLISLAINYFCYYTNHDFYSMYILKSNHKNKFIHIHRLFLDIFIIYNKRKRIVLLLLVNSLHNIKKNGQEVIISFNIFSAKFLFNSE